MSLNEIREEISKINSDLQIYGEKYENASSYEAKEEYGEIIFELYAELGHYLKLEKSLNENSSSSN